MKTINIKEMTDAEIAQRLTELRREKLNLKIQARTGQLEKPAKVRQARRDIARVLTEQTARRAKTNS